MSLAPRSSVVPALILLLGTACGSGGEGGGAGGTGPSPAARSIRVTLSDTLMFVGATVQAVATVYDGANVPIVGQSVRWVTSDTSVAIVSAAGAVTARRDGAFMVSAELTNAGMVALSGSATARARYAPGTWYLADSLLIQYGGTWGVIVSVPISGNRLALVIGGSDSGAGTSGPGCGRIPPAYVEVSASGKLSQQASRIAETTPSQRATYHMLTADFNGDGITDIHLAGSGCDIPSPGIDLRDYPKILLGDADGSFRETPLPSPRLQQHAAAIGVTRPGAPVDLLMISGLCYALSSADTLPLPYRGVNWLPGCAAPGPFIFRGRGDGSFTYDNTSLHTPLARSIVGVSGEPTVPNVAGAVLCDANGDGANDLITSYKSAAPTRPAGQVYVNDKSGRFLAAPIPLPLPSAGGQLPDLYCRDFDRDGKVDLLTTRVDPSNAGSSGNLRTDWQFLHGNGDGTFTNATAQAFPGQALGVWTHQIHEADIDRDGHPDLVGARGEYGAGWQVPVWFGTATPGVWRNASPSEVPRIAWASSTVTAWNLLPVQVGDEVMLVSRVERSSFEESSGMAPQLAAIPKGWALVRLHRRAP